MSSLPFEYTYRRSRGNSTTLRITPDGEVKVSSPWFVPKILVEKYLHQKKDWILSHLENIPKADKPGFSNGEDQLFLGRSFPLVYKPTPYITKARISFDEKSFILTVPKTFTIKKSQTTAKKLLLDWYLKYGQKHLFERASFYSQQLNVEFNRLVLKKVSSIWGSCSSKNNLNFNRKLVMAPPEVIDYVVIHEVCHLVHRHHRRTFWQLVKTLDPEYHLHKLWLSNNHRLLTL